MDNIVVFSPHQIHIYLEIITSMMFLGVGLIAYKLYNTFNYHLYFKYLGLTGILLFVINTFHMFAAIMDPTYQFDNFVPSTWFLGKLLYPVMLFVVLTAPVRVRLVKSTILLLSIIGLSFTTVCIWDSYIADLFFSRPTDLIPMVLAMGIAIKGLYQQNSFVKKPILNSLVIFMITEFLMSLSTQPFDIWYFLGHIGQICYIGYLYNIFNKILNRC